MAKDTLTSSEIHRPARDHSRFAHAFGQQVAVIGSILHHEASNRVQAPLEAILALIEPLIMLSVMCIAFLFFARLPPYGTSMLLFMTTGFLPFYFFIYVSRRMSKASGQGNRRFPIEQTLDYVFAHLVLRMIDYGLLGVLVFGGLYLYGILEAMPHDIVPVAQAFALLAVFSWGLGLINIAIGKLFVYWNYLFPAFARLFMLFSGVHFVGDFMTPNYRYVMTFNPLFHAVALFRTGFYPQYPHLTLDMEYFIWSSIFSLFLGLVAERATRRLQPLRRKV